MDKSTSTRSPMILQPPTGCGDRIIVGQNNPTFTASNRFVAIKGNRPRVSIITNMAIVKLHTDRLCGIFNYFQIKALRKFKYRIYIGTLTIQMHRHNRLSLVIDHSCCCLNINAERIGSNWTENRFCTCHNYRIRGSHKGHVRDNHFIAIANIQSFEDAI